MGRGVGYHRSPSLRLNFFLKFADTFIRNFMNVEILIVEDEGLIALDLKKRLAGRL
jgi:hypothetical protein